LWTQRRTAAQVRVAIVGAGIAGLAAAHRLDLHCDVVLYGADSRAGGTHTQYWRTVMRSIQAS
jgi:predicted NAD/FAD-binding protein